MEDFPFINGNNIFFHPLMVIWLRNLQLRVYAVLYFEKNKKYLK